MQTRVLQQLIIIIMTDTFLLVVFSFLFCLIFMKMILYVDCASKQQIRID